jgi:hypothetical protein
MMTVAPPTKKHKQKKATLAPSNGGTFSFHPEDEYLQKVRRPDELSFFG